MRNNKTNKTKFEKNQTLFEAKNMRKTAFEADRKLIFQCRSRLV